MAPPDSRDLTVKETLHTSRFYLLCGLFFLNSMAVTFFASNWKIGPNSSAFGDKFLSVVGSFGSAANCLGRIAWGQLGDRTSLRFVLSLLSCVFAGCLVLWGTVGGACGYLAGLLICVCYSCVGGTFALFPPLATVAFGPTHFTTILGLLFLVQLFAPSLASVLDMSLRHTMGIGPLAVLFGLCTASTALIVLCFGRRLDKPCRPPARETRYAAT